MVGNFRHRLVRSICYKYNNKQVSCHVSSARVLWTLPLFQARSRFSTGGIFQRHGGRVWKRHAMAAQLMAFVRRAAGQGKGWHTGNPNLGDRCRQDRTSSHSTWPSLPVMLGSHAVFHHAKMHCIQVATELGGVVWMPHWTHLSQELSECASQEKGSQWVTWICSTCMWKGWFVFQISRHQRPMELL